MCVWFLMFMLNFLVLLVMVVDSVSVRVSLMRLWCLFIWFF